MPRVPSVAHIAGHSALFHVYSASFGRVTTKYNKADTLMPSSIVSKVVLLSALAVPALAVSFRTFLVEHPLSSSRTRNIKKQATLSPSCRRSASLDLVNPKHHQAWADSYSIDLSRQEIGYASDEELLARFTKGFFGGWTFAAESNILMILHAFGRQLFPLGFSSRSYQMTQY
jgi:hypothetical protein